jgi:hypothetical protein
LEWVEYHNKKCDVSYNGLMTENRDVVIPETYLVRQSDGSFKKMKF